MKRLLANIYSILPFKRILLSGLRMVWIPDTTIARHLHFKGVFTVPVNSLVSFKMKHHGSGFAMESDHFWKGVHAAEPYSVAAWMKYAQTCDLIMDIGANTGSYTLIAGAINPQAEIHAFEPVQRICKNLEYNCSLNHFSVHIHHQAVSSETGKVYLMDQGGANEYMSHVSTEQTTHTYAVDSIRMDAFKEVFLKAAGVLMKIDVEGHEAEVLLGMGELFQQVRPVILLEVLDAQAAASLNNFFDGMNYVLFNIDETKGYRRINTIEKSDDNNIFCCPAEKYQSLL